MKNKAKQKRRLGKALSKRRKEVEEERAARNWRNYWVRAGILNDEPPTIKR
ncbi:DUF3983 domain-containing protein [Cytobacillus sp. FSL W8-0315]|uniref:DUF3983 domain-containing protein n=1 Tax=Cytobacillus sp. FSL W8-0315 TaxID=2921600 RepID=UPI0030F98B93